jgi:hypothetical protein
MFDVLFIYLLYVSLCVRVDDVSFKWDQEQPFEEVEQQFLGEDGKWFSPLAYSILSQ